MSTQLKAERETIPVDLDQAKQPPLSSTTLSNVPLSWKIEKSGWWGGLSG
jgi:hypothetical protein